MMITGPADDLQASQIAVWCVEQIWDLFAEALVGKPVNGGAIEEVGERGSNVQKVRDRHDTAAEVNLTAAVYEVLTNPLLERAHESTVWRVLGAGLVWTVWPRTRPPGWDPKPREAQPAASH